MKCPQHPKYKGLRDPKVQCEICNTIRIRSLLEQMSKQGSIIKINEKLKRKLSELYGEKIGHIS